MANWMLALLGGCCIGLAAVILMATRGSIMGISGIVSRLLPPSVDDWLWRVVFLTGVMALPVMMIMFNRSALERSLTDSSVLLVIGGLLVGMGTVTGNGCTSGHGVCGLSRFSVRSLVAVLVFMLAAFITVFFSRHLVGA